MVRNAKKIYRPKEKRSELVGRNVRLQGIDDSFFDAIVVSYDEEEDMFLFVYTASHDFELLKGDEDFFEIDWGLYPKFPRENYSQNPPGTHIVYEDSDGFSYEAMVYDDCPADKPGKIEVFLFEELEVRTIDQGEYYTIVPSPVVEDSDDEGED